LTEEERVMSRAAVSMEKRDFPAEFTYAHKCVDRAIDFLNNHGDEDFFLTVSFDEPHSPHICPREYYENYEDFELPKSANIYDTLENKPDYQKAWADEKLYQDKDAIVLKEKYFFGCNTFVDYEIGKVLDEIERVAPDAVVIYTSDHGALMDSHSLYFKGPCVYEECAHIPFIIKGKDVPKNVVDEAPVSHVNIAPTIFELFGFTPPKVFEGKSLLSQIEGKCNRVNDYVFIEFGRYEIDHDCFGGFQPMRAAFDGRYKLSINLLSTDELYDLKSDPAEMNNLINSPLHAAIRDRLHDAILANMNNTRDPFRGYYWERRPWRKDASPATWRYTSITRQREDEDYEPRQLCYYDGLPMKESVRKLKIRARFG
jgi:arylsulfatase A-like enzyme